MKSFIRSLSLAGLVFAALPRLGLAQIAAGNNAGGTVSQESQTQGPAGQTDFQTDPFTGRFSYNIPLELAPARHGSTPSVELQYNSANPNGWCGVGWDIDLGYIERETRFGVPVLWANGFPIKAYDDSKGFRFSLKRKSADLVNVTDRAYRAQIQSDFTQFHLDTNNNQWVATDTSGNQYFFGTTTNSSMSNPKSGWTNAAGFGDIPLGAGQDSDARGRHRQHHIHDHFQLSVSPDVHLQRAHQQPHQFLFAHVFPNGHEPHRFNHFAQIGLPGRPNPAIDRHLAQSGRTDHLEQPAFLHHFALDGPLSPQFSHPLWNESEQHVAARHL